jgi:hypothetical protein
MGVWSSISDFFTGGNTPGTVGYEETRAALGKPTTYDKIEASLPTVIYGPPNVTAKWYGDPYDYNFYMTLPKSKWLASMDWLSRKLYSDAAAGRFTQGQMASIKAYVKSMGFNSIGTVAQTVADAAGQTANDIAGMVKDGVKNGLKDAANEVTGGSGGLVLAAGFIMVMLLVIKR